MRAVAALFGLLIQTCSVHANELSRVSIQFSEKHQLETALGWSRRYSSTLIRESAEADERSGESEDIDAKFIQGDSLRNKPYAAIGKLFYFDRQYVPRPRSCTAFFVADTVLMTAAHCVMGLDGQWREDFIFFGSFGSEQVDIYSIRCVAIPSKWGDVGQEKALEHDFAFLKTTRRSTRGHLKLVDSKPVRSVRVIGYGASLAAHLIELEQRDAEIEYGAGHLSLLDNPMGPGSSGAPWIVNGDQVISLSSHYEGASKRHLNGPLVTADAHELKEFVEAGCQ